MVRAELKQFLRRSGWLPYVERWCSWAMTHPSAGRANDYQRRMQSERGRFSDQVDVHDLPPIFHYWSNRHLLPLVQAFGFTTPDDFFVQRLSQCYGASDRKPRRFVSIGAGNCDTEVRLARRLVDAGQSDFVIECLDITKAMLGRGQVAAQAAGVATQVVPLLADFNRWTPVHQYDAVLANQSLHHVVELERLFDAVRGALLPHGRFVVADIIGRNGHQRWPEALALVQQFWAELPAKYRFNRALRRHEQRFLDWDCSVEGFEGIRAQDVLPQLSQRFSFEMFLPFANLIGPFVDRSFGGNFDAAGEWDRAFIDRVHARDELEIQAGRITPTQMFAVLAPGAIEQPQIRNGLTPQRCIRTG